MAVGAKAAAKKPPSFTEVFSGIPASIGGLVVGLRDPSHSIHVNSEAYSTKYGWIYIKQTQNDNLYCMYYRHRWEGTERATARNITPLPVHVQVCSTSDKVHLNRFM